MTDMREDAVSRLEPELASLIRRLEMNYRRRGYPMERAHYLLLSRLEDGALSTGEIAERLHLDHSTVVRQVAAVEALGLATRVVNPRDRRSVLVGITERGAANVAAMRKRRCDRLRLILGDWPEADRDRFADLVERFNAALVAGDAAAGGA